MSSDIKEDWEQAAMPKMMMSSRLPSSLAWQYFERLKKYHPHYHLMIDYLWYNI
jgi:hypothetical protein